MSDWTERDHRLLVYGGFAMTLAVVIVFCRPWNLTDHFMIGAPFGRDFVNYWMGGRLALDALLAWSACLSPAALTTVAYGQFSDAMAALAIVAITRAERRPALAGLCLEPR